MLIFLKLKIGAILKRVHSKKYQGVFHYPHKNGDITYYIGYKENGKRKEKKIGKKIKEGITEVICKNHRERILNEIRLGDDAPHKSKVTRNKITLDEISEIFFKDKEIHNKNNKQDKNRYINHLHKPFGKKALATLTEDDLIEFQKKKLSSTSQKRPLTPKTINNITAVLSSMINHAIRKNLYSGVNVVSMLKKLAVDNERERYLNTLEIDLLLKTVKDNELLHLFCLLALSTGARLDSILLIQKKDIRLEKKEIFRIQDTKTKDSKKAIYKGFISNELYDVLKDKLLQLNHHDHIINLAEGAKIKPQQMEERLQPVLNKLFNQGLDSRDAKNRTVIHSLRHTFASHLAINNTPIYTIMK